MNSATAHSSWSAEVDITLGLRLCNVEAPGSWDMDVTDGVCWRPEGTRAMRFVAFEVGPFDVADMKSD